MSRKRQDARNSGHLETRSFIRGFVTRPPLRLGPGWNYREQRVGGLPAANSGRGLGMAPRLVRRLFSLHRDLGGGSGDHHDGIG